MKQLINLVAIILLLHLTTQAQQGKNCEDQVSVVAEKNLPTRGKNIFIVKPEQRRKLDELYVRSRGVNSCYIKIQNKTAMEINVFIDSSYVGYIEPNKPAFINRSKNYQIIHCWSSRGDIKWIQKGNCSGCMRDMILLPKQ